MTWSWEVWPRPAAAADAAGRSSGTPPGEGDLDEDEAQAAPGISVAISLIIPARSAISTARSTSVRPGPCAVCGEVLPPIPLCDEPEPGSTIQRSLHVTAPPSEPVGGLTESCEATAHGKPTAVDSAVRLPVLWWWLACLTALLAAAASGVGLLAADRIYDRETVVLSDAATAQDIVTLLVVAPLLALLALGVRRGSLAAFLCLPGILAFTTYNYVIYAFSIHFGPLFLVWVALLGLSIFTLVGGLATANMSAIKDWFAGRAMTGTAAF
jgi:hypothetical protein